MNNRKIKIVADSSGDIISLPSVDFTAAPLKIITAEKQYVDNAELNTLSMVNDLQTYKGKSSSSCPNTEDWLAAFGDANEVYCVTITATLSGSYNSAMLAKKTYEEKHPESRVFVLNSLSTGPEIALHLYKIRELVLEQKSFEEICDTVTAYTQSTALLFMLESMKNLANNGRVSPIVAKMAGLLGIRVVGKASSKGDLEPLNKCRGEKRAIEEMFVQMKSIGYNGGRVKIAHCFNESAASALETTIKSEFTNTEVDIYPCGGLCSFYAEKHGMLVGFEHK